ncbi:MAG: Dam family site-specific DNA-(adenine-N6)-methyltransferase [Anaerolineae bacterium]|nr:Dam family site-specific DNA-(adenine-N6)-methyltransferase [Anaerolineae bacterium]
MNIVPKPPLKWAGGKRWLVPELKKMWQTHQHRRLVEPFCGGLAVTLGLQPDTALLNDINPHLINFYLHLQQGLDATITSEEFEKDIFYARRDRFNGYILNGQENTRESAVLFYYLNRSCFNGLCRFNRKGLFNVPIGSYKRVKYMVKEEFLAYQSVLSNWHFQTGDFEDVELQSDDFIYADPPYDVDFTSYAQEDFLWDDQKRLIKWLAQHDGPVVLSNQATDRIIKLYKEAGYELMFLDAPRRISSDGDRSPAKEVLALRNIEKPVSDPTQMKLF